MSLSGVGLLLALSWFPVLFLRTEAAGSCLAAIKSPPYILGLPGVPGRPGPPGALSDTEVKQLERNLLKDVQNYSSAKASLKAILQSLARTSMSATPLLLLGGTG